MRTQTTENCNKLNYAALYMRLSKEDDKGTESASIETQRKILRAYAHENSFIIYDEYVDDGFTGTNLNRPAFQRMQSDIEAGKINVVLTKDLSRLGRNSSKVGLLLDEYFPEHRIRYIAVNNGFDSGERNATNHIVAPMQNFVNELYAADISGKIRASFDIKMKEGEFIGAFAPYGYRKDPNNKNHLVIDENAAKTVRRIFALSREGYSPMQIARILNDEQILTPSLYRYQMHPHLSVGSFRGAEEWKSGTIGKLLRNEVYLGHTLQGKTEKPNFKSSYTYAKPKNDWIVVENTHEAIIDGETWNIVRKRAISRTQKREKGFVNIFSGLAKCADCGKNMSSVGTRKKGATANLNCGGYKLNGRAACTNHTIDYDTLYQAVLTALKGQICLGEEEKRQLLEEMLKQSGGSKEAEGTELQKKLATVNSKLEQLFDDKYAGLIDMEQFDRIHKRYARDKADCESKLKAIAEVQAIKKDAAEVTGRYQRFQKLIAEYDDLQELTQDLLFKLIDRIDVHQGEYIESAKYQRIDIYFKFQCESKTLEITPAPE